MDNGFVETVTIKQIDNGWFMETARPGFTYRSVFTNPLECLGHIAAHIGIHGKIKYGGNSFIA